MRASLRRAAVIFALAVWIASPSGRQPVPADSAQPRVRTATAAARRAPGDPPLLRREERGRRTPGTAGAETVTPAVLEQTDRRPAAGARHEPREQRMQRAGSFDGDLRSLTDTGPVKRRERPEREKPEPAPVELRDPNQAGAVPQEPTPSGVDIPQTLSAPAPGPLASFEGLDFATWGAGHPPDTNGDVGPTHYIQTVNTSIGIYEKASGTRVAAFTFDTFMSLGNFGNLCDTDNFGDPVVLYDTFEDRWIITDFAFTLDASNNIVNPPGAFECFAVSKTGDPVAGGWNFYAINTTGGLGDYPKLGVWPDGLYMSVNMFDYAIAGSFQNVRLYALNKAQMYAGTPSVQVISFDVPATEFTLLPSNARLQTGTPPAGSPNYFASVWNYLNVVGVWKFHVDWNNTAASTLTGPFNAFTATNWSQLTNPSVPSPAPGNDLDTLYPRLMMQNQYSNVDGVESLWNSHSVGASGATSSQAAVRYYQVRVTGDAVEANATQAFTYSPNTTHRFMPSVAVDRAGNMAIGYSATSTSLFPAIRYAGRLAGDPANTITQTETSLIEGTGTQDGNCGGSSCERWGDYSAMTLDPDGCTFWYTNEYYQVTGLDNRTRVGAFSFSACSPVGAGTLQGTVKTSSLVPIAGATVTLGSRTATTDSGGNYSFTDLAAGTYPGATASFPGYLSSTFTAIAVTSGGTTTRDFVLNAAPQSGCVTDTTQADFQGGMSMNCDVTASPGDVILANPATIDQQNLSVTNSGFGINTTTWGGQTFTPAVTGTLTRVDLDLFCSGCTGTTPDITVSIRATSGSPPVPTAADLAVATIPGFSSGAGGYFTAQFASPATLTAGTRYAVIFRPVANPSAGTYAYVCSCGNGPANTNPYANGQRVTSANSGSSWSADTTSGGRDLGFVTYMQSGFIASGTFVSSLKDANPAAGGSAMWGMLSWNATAPAGTTLQFQAAASNSATGPFTFVGPDGTAGTFFANGASLAQFNDNRYLKYRAVLTTSNSSVTPAIHDVTVCFDNVPTTSATLAPGSVTFGGKRLVGTTGPPAPPVTITNNGPGALVFASFNGVAPAASFTVGTDFPATTNCPLTSAGLAAGGSCQFTFSFSPVAAGPRDATLTIATNATNSPHAVVLSGVGFVVDGPTVTATVASGAARLQQLQNVDGGWYFPASGTGCGTLAFAGGSCRNIVGVTGLGLLSAYDRTGDPGALADAVQAGQLLQTIHDADPTQQPFSQDLEFLRALSVATGNAQWAALATTWFNTITAAHPVAAGRADWAFTRRGDEGRFTLAVWDLASTIRSAKAAGEPDYATGLANQIIARESEWKDITVAHRWDQCTDEQGCGPAGNKRAFDYTLLGMGSLLWAIHDLPGFSGKIDEYRSWLLSQQDAAGTWDVGNLQTTSYVALGLGAVGGAGTTAAIDNAAGFFIANQQPNGGWPFSIANGVSGAEFTTVDSEIIRAIDLLYSTGSGSSVTVSPAQLATITFDTVSTAGITSVVATSPTSARVPNGYTLVSGLTYDVTTTAIVSGQAVMCLSVPWDALEGSFESVRLLQPRNKKLLDRTILQGPLAPDASAKRLCAELDSLEPVSVALANRKKN